jgi:tetratricopeptide (TPR) repeat protein
VWDKAVAYGRQAGARALARSAYREAGTTFEQALMALQHLPEHRDTLEQAIDLRFDLRVALQPLGEYGRIFDYLRDAETLAETLGDQRRLGLAAVYLINYFWVRGDYDRALASGQRAFTIATALGDLVLQVRTHFNLGQVYHSLGDYQQAIDVLQRNVAALTGELRYKRLGGANVPSVNSRGWLLWCLAELGAFAEGRALGDEAIQIAETVDHPYSRGDAYHSVGRLYLRQGDFPKAISILERGLEVCQAADIWLFVPMLASELGAAYTLAGRLPEALPLLEQAVAQTTAMGRVSHLALWTIQLSAGYLLAGRLEDALPLAHHALTLTRTQRGTGLSSARPAASGGHPRPAPAPRRRARRDPLPGSPRPGRRTRHAPAPGALPPGPRHAVCQDRPARAGAHRTVRCH